MIEDLKFVKGAISKKNILTVLAHFSIKDGLIKGYNGNIALCSPIELDLNCQPKAELLTKAIERCEKTVQLSMTPAGKLTVKSGSFKSHVECDPAPFPDVEPEGEMMPLPGGLLAALKILEPMIGEDMTRPWARGVLFRDQFAFATNNVVITQYWLGYSFPFDMVIPHDAVNEILRIGKEPISMQVAENSVTFHYEGGRWIRTQTFSTEWPDIGRVLDRDSDPANHLVPSEVEFFESLEKLVPFTDELNSVYLSKGFVSTSIEEASGTSMAMENLDVEARFNLKMLLMISAVAEKIDFSHIPQGPALFFGSRLRGAIMAMRI